MKEMVKKCSTDQRFILKEITSWKILSLGPFRTPGPQTSLTIGKRRIELLLTNNIQLYHFRFRKDLQLFICFPVHVDIFVAIDPFDLGNIPW